MIPSSRQSADTEVLRCAIAAWASRTWAFDSANVLAGLTAARPRGREPGQCAFADQLPLELGQRREDAKHEAAGRRGGVDLRALTGEHPQAHAAGRQILHGVDQALTPLYVKTRVQAAWMSSWRARKSVMTRW